MTIPLSSPLSGSAGEPSATRPAPFARPADFCRRLLGAMDASDGRRRRRARDTTPDAIGMAIERSLAERAIREDPDPFAFEGWLAARCDEEGDASGPHRAIALRILDQWRLARLAHGFADWLERGAPSDDA